MELYPEFFNDVFGPITQPGSSSHMAGPCRAGFMAHSLLCEPVKDICIILDKRGSFCEGFGQMNEDLGMLNGAYGKLCDNAEFFEIKQILAQAGISYTFQFQTLQESSHPNAMKFILTGISGKTVTAVLNSTGGGMVETVQVEQYPLRERGDTYVILLPDFDTTEQFDSMRHILTQHLDILDSDTVQGRDGKYAYRFHSGVQVTPEQVRHLTSCEAAMVMAAVLPVLTNRNKKPQRFDSVTKWRQIAQEENKSLYEVALEYEEYASGWSREEVVRYMKEHVETYMQKRIFTLYEDESRLVINPFRTIYYKEWQKQSEKDGLTGSVIQKAIHYMHSAQAQMDQVLDVPGPMSNGGGYLYSVLTAVKEECHLSEEDVTRGLFIAAAIGATAYTRTNPTGEVIGCAGECGVCAAMTAAAVAEMFHATPEQVENAASMTLQSSIGWPCDPVPGGQGTPCTSRTLFIVTMSVVYASWAMMGSELIIPFHEVLDTADKVGRQLSGDLLCTGRGGLCATNAGRSCKETFCSTRECRTT